jgi:type I restriction-modification system DNA methylase subunit
MARVADSTESPVELLEAAYKQLEFDQGALVPAARQPQAETQEGWLEKGDWQSLAAQVGAEKIFFVDRDPVVVFAKSEDNSLEVLRRLYERLWCMSRPQLLFLATPGQLMVFDLTKSPPRPNETLDGHDRLIATVASVAEVQSRLGAYHRERIETGAVFGDERFRNSLNRADRALIRDLKTVRHQLATIASGRGSKRPELKHLHSLIGRAIFVRYLEDREILVSAYFDKVASHRKEWKRLLEQQPSGGALEPRMKDLLFVRVLQNKEFTYALFEQLADDFNGDTFPVEEDERTRIQQEHLDTLRGFLLGNTTPQEEMFFFAYRFDVIPIELISTIYEEFYNEQTGKDRNQGSHYTPPALVEFVLAHTLTPQVLATKPRVIDPACGSGIFLVESFRRMVRQFWAEQNGKRVSRMQLRKILREQIAGMDINEEAVRVAAFSLYLAFLHYQEPREINDERRLPYLKWVSEDERKQREKRKPGALFFDILLHANSFEVIAGKYPTAITQRFGPSSAAVVVGNPPWGYPKKDDKDGQKALTETVKWCDAKKGRPIGDKELSQAFIHLTLEILQDGGRAGLLASSGIFFKHHKNSVDFRKVWLQSSRLEHVVNFAHVRKIFFSDPQREAKGISPFVSVVFEKTQSDSTAENRFQYWSAKRTATIANTQCVVLTRGDMRWLSQRACLANARLWKIYWWGGHRDELFISGLERFPKLIDLPEHFPKTAIFARRGFQEGNKSRPAKWLRHYLELPSRSFVRYGPIDTKQLIKVPTRVEHRGAQAVYHGHRLLVGRGVKEGGVIVTRLATQNFCFRNSIHGIRLKEFEPWQEAVALGIFWSSLARYYYFTTSGSWGQWHDEIHLNDVKEMPICFPKHAQLRERIVGIVEQLQSLELEPGGLELAGVAAHRRLPRLERELNEAIFELYQLDAAEQDLVDEMCTVGLDLFYRHQESNAVLEIILPTQSFGTLADVQGADDGMAAYLRTFLELCDVHLSPDGEFAWRILSPPSRAPLLAVCFTTQYNSNPLPKPTEDDAVAWRKLLARLETESVAQGNSSRIFIDTFFRYISDREVLFIKRNERRFWTRTAAREDAESALVYWMNSEDAAQGGKQ